MSEAYCDGGYSNASGRGMWCYFFNGNHHHGIVKESEYGNLTSNVMEYLAVLNLVKSLPSNLHIDIMSDSQLVMRQLSGVWKLNYDHLRQIATEIEELIRVKRLKVSFKWTSRDENPAGHFIEIHGKALIGKNYRPVMSSQNKREDMVCPMCE